MVELCALSLQRSFSPRAEISPNVKSEHRQTSRAKWSSLLTTRRRANRYEPQLSVAAKRRGQATSTATQVDDGRLNAQPLPFVFSSPSLLKDDTCIMLGFGLNRAHLRSLQNCHIGAGHGSDAQSLQLSYRFNITIGRCAQNVLPLLQFLERFRR